MKNMCPVNQIYSILALIIIQSLHTFHFYSEDISLNHAGPSINSQYSNKLLIEINHFTYTLADQHDHFYSFIGVRTLSMVHLAIHDILNSIRPRYAYYAYGLKNPEVDPASAVIQATRILLSNAYPYRKDTIDLVCNRWLSALPSSDLDQSGIDLGNKVAGFYIRLREGDGHEKQGSYTPMTKPGDYQYTPGWNHWVLKPDFNYAAPFALDTVSQFRSPPPPDLGSNAYTESYREVKAYGCKNSRMRTEDQTHYAHWWAEFAEHSWNRIGRITARAIDLPVHETARLFALINMDIYDIYLASLESKYYYDTWRPYTAIRSADQDGNPSTDPDPDWEPEMLTPPWPEYPSAHAAVAAGGAEIVSDLLGTSEISIEMESVTALEEARKRSFSNLDAAARECADSRIMNGFHFRFATEEGLRQGRKIARFILDHYLRPLN